MEWMRSSDIDVAQTGVDTPLSVAIKKTDKPVKYWVCWLIFLRPSADRQHVQSCQQTRLATGGSLSYPCCGVAGVPVPRALLPPGWWRVRQVGRSEVRSRGRLGQLMAGVHCHPYFASALASMRPRHAVW
jgi:hypothetical protein